MLDQIKDHETSFRLEEATIAEMHEATRSPRPLERGRRVDPKNARGFFALDAPGMRFL